MACFACVFLVMAVFCVSSLAYALTIPDELPDGVYEVDWLPGLREGIASITYFDIPHDVNMTAVKSTSKLPLPVNRYDVNCLRRDKRVKNLTWQLTRSDDQAKAMRMLGNWCELATYVQKDAMVFAVVNDMMWYVCNWDNRHNALAYQQHCSRREMEAAAERMDKGCGKDKRAQLSIGHWQKTYGRSHRFGDVCRMKDTWSGHG
ncbi:hypothetical protein G3M48_008673 [Beauveria asiatica]|uniref:Secreted protein n=1 Tax=Beauveria asiatica TaxID=1069075 RepID=A0AAW0RK10_9HYPO